MADKTSQTARRKAALLADQLVEAASGTPPEISNAVPTTNAVLARPAVRHGLLLLTIATLAVLAWRNKRHH
ncbi:hypothetical protein OTB20_23325 [Streptomyces sp. H27-H1]|uniref:hypothetical protein n=1 Tax=Streptomyces sp. H27-H1 TaxID=2996461 RepID=UPI00226D99EB|nr:hypothetical protein [Streptomyces sp. H27-H1]MCY0929076.1 hypothetical protein [Streptomyces sp. H27-H1]